MRDGGKNHGYDWALASVYYETGTCYQRWLLARRSLGPNAKGELEIASWVSSIVRRADRGRASPQEVRAA